MKVALVQEGLDPRRGGAETSTLELAAALSRCGARVTVVCSGRTAPPAGAPFEVRCLSALGVTKRRRTLAFIEQADRLCAAGDFEIVHAISVCRCCNVYQPRGGTIAETVERGLHATRRGLPRMLSRLGRRFNRRQRALRRVEHELLNSADPPFVAAVSRYVAQQVLSLAPALPPIRLQVVFNGVDVAQIGEAERLDARASLRHQLGLAEHARLGVFLAHNFKLKGLRCLIEALAQRPAPCGTPWTLLVAGRGAAGPYQRLAQRRRVAERVRWLGPRGDARQIIAAADALLHPTWYDPCSRVVLEALALGIPAVTTRWNGAAEVMTPGTHGQIVDEPDDPARLAHAIEQALSAECMRRSRTDAERIAQQLSMTRHARELLGLYERVLAAGRRVRCS